MDLCAFPRRVKPRTWAQLAGLLRPLEPIKPVTENLAWRRTGKKNKRERKEEKEEEETRHHPSTESLTA